jgi:hypothetical protein
MNLMPPVEDLKIPYGYPASFIYPVSECDIQLQTDISDYTWQGTVYDAKGETVGSMTITTVDDFTVRVTIPEAVVNDTGTDCGKYILEADSAGGTDYLPVLTGKITVVQL